MMIWLVQPQRYLVVTFHQQALGSQLWLNVLEELSLVVLLPESINALIDGLLGNDGTTQDKDDVWSSSLEDCVIYNVLQAHDRCW